MLKLKATRYIAKLLAKFFSRSKINFYIIMTITGYCKHTIRLFIRFNIFDFNKLITYFYTSKCYQFVTVINQNKLPFVFPRETRSACKQNEKY